MTRKPKAPCGHSWNHPRIQRTFGILFPTAFAECKCLDCSATWTERYEFEFSVPLGDKTNEQAEIEYQKFLEGKS